MATNANPPLDEPAFEAALARLRGAIKRAHLVAGEPSTRLLAAQIRAFSHTTVAVVLRCERLPRWGQVELVAEALGFDVSEFHRLWIAARLAQLEQAGRDASGQGVDLRVRFRRHGKYSDATARLYFGIVDCGQLIEWYGTHRERLFDDTGRSQTSASLVPAVTAAVSTGRPKELLWRLNPVTVVASSARIAAGGPVGKTLDLIASQARLYDHRGITAALAQVARDADHDLRGFELAARVFVAHDPAHRKAR